MRVIQKSNCPIMLIFLLYLMCGLKDSMVLDFINIKKDSSCC